MVGFCDEGGAERASYAERTGWIKVTDDDDDDDDDVFVLIVIDKKILLR